MRFSEHLKIAAFQVFFREIGLEFANSACLRRIDGSFWKNDGLFHHKQAVVRAILRDIFQIPSLVILKTSDEILFPSEKIV